MTRTSPWSTGGWLPYSFLYTIPLNVTVRYVEHAASLAMREWKRLPRLVSHIHLQLLQAAQQVRQAPSSGQFVQHPPR